MDPDPGGPKTCGSCGSGSPTLEKLTGEIASGGGHAEVVASRQLHSICSGKTPSQPDILKRKVEEIKFKK
jgi:hypothetical protein